MKTAHLLGGVVLTAISLALFVPAQAGTIDLRVEQAALAAGPEGTVSVIVHLQEQAPVSAIHQDLKAARASRAVRHETVVRALQETADRTQAPLLDLLEAAQQSGRVIGFTPYWISNLIVAQVRVDYLEELAAAPEVDRIEPNLTVELIRPVAKGKWLGDHGEVGNDIRVPSREVGVTPGLRAINADLCWSELGLTGAGVLICGLDTGVDVTHPALADRWRGAQGAHPPEECWFDALTDTIGAPYDEDGHGTHTMGTMCGIDPANGDTVGVAWAADWIAANAIGQGAWCEEFDNDVIACFQWIADPDGNPETVDDVPDICQNSWGARENPLDDNYYYRCDDRWWEVIDNCEAVGVMVVFSAGNSGPWTMTCGFPGDRNTTPWNTYAVGAVDATNYPEPYPIAYFSSRGPSGCDELTIKPEVSGPGVDVVSCVPGDEYEPYSGTSMSAPHVSGVLALLREIDPDIEVERAKQILMDTTVDYGNAGEDNVYGWGFIDAYAACLAAMNGYGNLGGSVLEAGSGTPLEGARVSVAAMQRDAISDVTGAFDLRHLPAGTYEVTTELFGYDDDTSMITVEDGGAANLVVNLVSQPRGSVRGQVTDGREGLEGFVVTLMDVPVAAQHTDASGSFFFPDLPVRDYEISMGRFGWTLGISHREVTEGDTIDINYMPLLGAADNFEYDQGWTVGAPTDSAYFGIWERGDPNPTYTPGGLIIAPPDDHTSNGVQCFVTQNQPEGALRYLGDVDGGRTTLLSPVFDASETSSPSLVFWLWFHNSAGGPDDQQFRADLSGDSGQSWTNVLTLDWGDGDWQRVEIPLAFSGVEITDQMQIRFIAEDIAHAAAIVEAAVDDIEFTGFLSGTPDRAEPLALSLSAPRPNPLGAGTLLKFTLPSTQEVEVAVYDPAGRLVRRLVSGQEEAGTSRLFWDGRGEAGEKVHSGVYFVHLATEYRELSRKIVVSR